VSRKRKVKEVKTWRKHIFDTAVEVGSVQAAIDTNTKIPILVSGVLKTPSVIVIVVVDPDEPRSVRSWRGRITNFDRVGICAQRFIQKMVKRGGEA